jgi:hypothetical protein
VGDFAGSTTNGKLFVTAQQRFILSYGHLWDRLWERNVLEDLTCCPGYSF